MSTFEALMIAAFVISATGALAMGTAAAVSLAVDLAAITHKRNGGLHFIKAGRFGAAVWVSRR